MLLQASAMESAIVFEMKDECMESCVKIIAWSFVVKEGAIH